MKIRIKINKSEEIIPDILIMLFVLIINVGRMLIANSMLINLLLMIIGILALAFVFIKKHKSIGSIAIVGIVLSCLLILSTLYNNNSDMFDLLWIWVYLGLAALLYHFPLSKKNMRFTFYFVLFIYASFMLRGADASEVFYSISANNISVYLIFSLSLYFISLRETEGKVSLPYIPIIAVLIVTAWTGSRAALLTMLFFLITVVMYNLLYINKMKFSSFIKVTALVMVIFVFIDTLAANYLTNLLYKLDRYGMESSRTLIWDHYISAALDGLGSFVFGVSTENSRYAYLRENLHNAFFMLHAKYGVMGFLLIITCIFGTCWNLIKKKEFAYLIIIASLCIRSLFDWTAFPGCYDIFFFYCIFYFLGVRKRRLSYDVK